MLGVLSCERFPPYVGPTETFFLRRRTFKGYEDIQAYIQEERDHKKKVFKNLTKIARASEGAVTYEELKDLPPWEVDVVVEALDEMRREEERQIRLAKKSASN